MSLYRASTEVVLRNGTTTPTEALVCMGACTFVVVGETAKMKSERKIVMQIGDAEAPNTTVNALPDPKGLCTSHPYGPGPGLMVGMARP